MYLKKFNKFIINIISEQQLQKKRDYTLTPGHQEDYFDNTKEDKTVGQKVKRELLTRTNSKYNNYGGSYGIGYRLGAWMFNKKETPNNKFNKNKQQTATKDQISSNEDPITTFQTISKSELKNLIDNNMIKNKNPKIKNFNAIEKLFSTNGVIYWVAKQKGKIKACAGCVKNKDFNGYYINEIQSYEKGFGSQLIKHILTLDYDIIYCNSNWADKSEQEELDEYYSCREFDFTRFDKGKMHYFYKNKRLSNTELRKFKESLHN